jgi:glycogen synthase
MTADTVGGVWTYALELCRALAPFGVQVGLATMGAAITPDQWKEVRPLQNVEVFESEFRLEWMDNPWEDVRRAGAWLLDLEQQFQPDVIHLNNYAHGALTWCAPKIVVGHSCVLSWWVAVKSEAPPECWNCYREAVRAGLEAADAVVAPSRVMLDCLERFYGPFTRAMAVPNARRCETQRPSKQHLVLAAGRLWDEAKNIQILARVAGRLPWPTCVAGAATDPDGRRPRFDNVSLLGRLGLDEMQDWYGHASIYVLPARYEPFGLSALEAASAGCVLVLGDISSLREVWGDAALFVAPNAEEELARTLLALINDHELRAECAARALARSQLYTPERMVDGYVRVYGDVLNGRAGEIRHATDCEEVCA